MIKDKISFLCTKKCLIYLFIWFLGDVISPVPLSPKPKQVLFFSPKFLRELRETFAEEEFC